MKKNRAISTVLLTGTLIASAPSFAEMYVGTGIYGINDGIMGTVNAGVMANDKVAFEAGVMKGVSGDVTKQLEAVSANAVIFPLGRTHLLNPYVKIGGLSSEYADASTAAIGLHYSLSDKMTVKAEYGTIGFSEPEYFSGINFSYIFGSHVDGLNRDQDKDGIENLDDECPITETPKEDPDIKIALDEKGCHIIINQEKEVLSIEFDRGSSMIDDDDKKVLDKVVWFFNNFPEAVTRIELNGNASADGDQGHNIILSERRAEAARSYLVKNGVDTQLIKTTGKGASDPLVLSNDEKLQKVNRRVDIKLFYMEKYYPPK